MGILWDTVENVAKDTCYGCASCAAACGERAIKMDIDGLGFLKPRINPEKCIHCGLCVSTCPAVERPELRSIRTTEPFAAWSANSRIRMTASSGGAALQIALESHEKGRRVLGAVWSRDFRRVYHIVANNAAEIMETAGSKYVQSDLAPAMAKALANPQCEYIVSGTPCQIAGVRKLLDRKGAAETYTLVDFFCHGVPSYLVWWGFLCDVGREVGEPVYIDQRNKANGWHSYRFQYVGRNGVYSGKFADTLVGRFYLSDYCLRDSCYSCPYRHQSAADLRVGDFWGKEFASDNAGVSIAVPLTEKGFTLIVETQGLVVRSVPVAWVFGTPASSQKGRVDKPPLSDIALQRLANGEPLRRVYRTYLSKKYVQSAIRGFTRRLVGALLPRWAKTILRIVRRLAGS